MEYNHQSSNERPDKKSGQESSCDRERRSVIKKISAGLLGVLLGAKIGRHEKSVLQENFFEINGVRYTPLYEDHALGPEQQLPTETDLLFVETNYHILRSENGETKSVYIYDKEMSAQKLAEAFLESLVAGEIYQPKARKLMFEQITKEQIPLAYGDIGHMELTSGFSAQERTVKQDEKAFWGGLALLILGAATDSKQQKIKEVITHKFSRRKFLKILIAGSLTASSSIAALYGSWLATDTRKFREVTKEANLNRAMQRLLDRLHGMTTHFHPKKEGYASKHFFSRNIIMALKIKLLGERLKQEKNNPHISFMVGADHNGIEDLLYLPIPVLRSMFIYMTGEEAREAYQLLEEDVAKIRVIQANERGQFKDRSWTEDIHLTRMMKKEF